MRWPLSDKLFGFYERKTLSEPANAMNRILEDRFLSSLYTDELNLIRAAITYKNPSNILEIGAAGGHLACLLNIAMFDPKNFRDY